MDVQGKADKRIVDAVEMYLWRLFVSVYVKLSGVVCVLRARWTCIRSESETLFELYA